MIIYKKVIILAILFAASDSYAQNCQESIDELRRIYIVILKKTPAMPPLAQLSSPINQALQRAENYRDMGDHDSCISIASKTSQLMRGYAR